MTDCCQFFSRQKNNHLSEVKFPVAFSVTSNTVPCHDTKLTATVNAKDNPLTRHFCQTSHHIILKHSGRIYLLQHITNVWRRFYVVHSSYYDYANNSCDTSKRTIPYCMYTVSNIAYTCFGAIISQSSGSWHQNFLQTYSNKIGHNRDMYVYCELLYCCTF
jgi:hypothetical protein